MSDDFQMDSYKTVAERIQDFKAKFPDGSLRPANPDRPYDIVTVTGTEYPSRAEINRARARKDPIPEPTEVTKTFVVYTAEAWRHPEDPAPGIGVAWELFPGPTPYTKDSELMNAETSAWGRAIIAVLASESQHIASQEEVMRREAAQDEVEFASEAEVAEVVERVRQLSPEAKVALADWMAADQVPSLKRRPYRAEPLAQVIAWLDAEAAAPMGDAQAPPEPPQAPSEPEAAPTSPPADPEPPAAPEPPADEPERRKPEGPREDEKPFVTDADVFGKNGLMTHEEAQAWTEQLKGQKLLDTAVKFLGKGGDAGKVADIRARLAAHIIEINRAEVAAREAKALEGAQTDEGATGNGQPVGEMFPTEPPPPAEPKLGPADGVDPEGFSSDDIPEDDDAGFECPHPSCTEYFLYNDEGDGALDPDEYARHWEVDHPDGMPDEDAPADDPADVDLGAPVTPETLDRVKAAITGLKSDSARKYAQYRRSAGLPAPKDMTEGQALDLLVQDFMG